MGSDNLRRFSQTTKFATSVLALLHFIVDKVADILETVQEFKPYPYLKEAILKRIGRSFAISPVVTALHSSYFVKRQNLSFEAVG